MKKIHVMTLVSGVLISLLFSLDARVRTKQTSREFDQQVNKSNLMIALFYNNNKYNRKGTPDSRNVDSLLRMYESVSGRKLYDDADFTFVKVNNGVKGSELLAQRYGIKQFPTFILFHNRRVILDENGEMAMLTGFVTEVQLQNFIKKYCADAIEKEVQEKEARRKERIEASKNEADPYFYPAVIYTPSGDSSSWVKPLKYNAEGDEI